MSVELSARDRAERSVQEQAQAMVARGRVVPAVRLLDAFLAVHDGDWGLWLYHAGLCARLGLVPQAVAAYRACARQLEGDELYARARDVLRVAARVDPADASLRLDVRRLSGLLDGAQSASGPQGSDAAAQTCLMEPVPRPSPSIDLRPRTGPDPFSLLAEAPVTLRPSAARRPPPAKKPAQDPKHVKTSLVRRQARERSVTDPHLAIFDILDAEKAARGA